MRKLFTLTLVLLLGVLAACGGEENSSTTSDSGDNPLSVIQWPRDPLYVVFRADTVGGDPDPLVTALRVPECTIYGDGRAVWVTLARDGNFHVLFDFLDDATIQEFISWLAIDRKIYSYQEGYKNELPQRVTPVYRQLYVNVSGMAHVTDDFAGWEVNYYESILERCKTLSRTPRRFQPDGAWLLAEFVEDTRFVTYPIVYWDAEAAAFSFSGMAVDGSPQWVEGNVVRVLWQYLIETPGNVLFEDVFGRYRVAMQVPGVTLNAPPAPNQ